MRGVGPRVKRALIGLLVLYAGCIATPLPTPPTADVSKMTLIEGAQPDEVDLHGVADAITGELLSLRVSSSLSSAETTVAVDGSFDVIGLPAMLPPLLYLEAITADEDVFLVAVERGAGTSVLEADAGPDRDFDGSPDAIDCAPDDPMLAGSRCPVVDTDGDGFSPPDDCDDTNPGINPGAGEVCGNGLDDNCDGVVEDGCGAACRTDADCGPAQACIRGFCG